MKPLFPYAGSSKKVAPLIASIIYNEFRDLRRVTYCEPMVGSGAVFFELCPPNAILNDIEPLTANLYEVVRDHPYDLCETLREIPPIRDEFMRLQPIVTTITDEIDRAASWYFLLTLCYNGVVKFKGANPRLSFGDRHLTWVQRRAKREQSIHAASKALQSTIISCASFELVPKISQVTFFDPPWFDSAEDYGVTFEHLKLAAHLGSMSGLTDRWLLTINDCEKAWDTYMPHAKWHIPLSPFYSVAPVASTRKKTPELLIANFKPLMFGG
jgi:site-specific DNA-adenine methylase